MQYNRYLYPLVGLFSCALWFVNVPDCNANLIFDVTLDTSPLQVIGQRFLIDFQLNDGSGIGDANNTVRITNFHFGGGGVGGTPFPPLGGATGDLSLSFVRITDKEFLNEFTQEFVFGSTLSFRVNLTTKLDDAGLTPDAFSFAILDGISGAPLPTTGLGDALLLVNINSSTPRIEPFPTSADSPIQLFAPQVRAVAETASSISMLLIGLGAVWCWRCGCLRLDKHSRPGSGAPGDAATT
jgi:hypothetical protein